MKIKLTEEQYKRVILKEESNSDSYPCASKFYSAGHNDFFKKMLCHKYPDHEMCKEKNKKIDNTDAIELRSTIEKEMEDLFNNTKVDKTSYLEGFIFRVSSKYPQKKTNVGWRLYSKKIGKQFYFKSGYLDNDILSMKFRIPHGYGKLLREFVENLSLPNYLNVYFITDGSKDCWGWADCDDVRIEIDFDKKGSCGKSELANMIIDAKPINLGIDSNYLELTTF